MNNIFNYATKELSQDAVICWIFSHLTSDEDAELKSIAISMLDRFFRDAKITLPDYSKIKIEQQESNIDILLTINDTYKIIIEDKVCSSLHDDQIERYKETISVSCPEENIITVYFKTGFYYDNDVSVVADSKITGHEFLQFIKPHENCCEILKSYTAYLEEFLGWYEEIENEYKNDFKKTLNEQYGQYLFMKDIFGKTAKLRHGSSYGKSWTQYDLPRIHNDFKVFYRLDRSKHGFYLSLRQYDNYADKSKDFETLCHIFSTTADKFPDLIVGKHRGSSSYCESEFGVFFLDENDFESIVKNIPLFTTDFLLEFKKHFS